MLSIRRVLAAGYNRIIRGGRLRENVHIVLAHTRGGSPCRGRDDDGGRRLGLGIEFDVEFDAGTQAGSCFPHHGGEQRPLRCDRQPCSAEPQRIGAAVRAATHYFSANPTSSEANYVAILGGSAFGVTSDDAYWKNRVDAPSLITQLDAAGISWKAYLQSLPYPGYQGICYPEKCNGAPDSDPLYVSKHDAIQNFLPDRNNYDWTHQVPITELSQDLSSGNVPRFNYIVPDECHDMHGDPPYCLDSGNIGDPQNQHLVAVGDQYLGQLVSEITSAPFWAKGNNAIAVTFDSGDNNRGCCGAKPGGGQVATVVITSHGPRHVQDPAPSNHYSMLSSIQHAFGLGCLEHTCDTTAVKPLTPLFAVTGNPAVATTPLPVPNYPTPTPTPTEPHFETTATPSSGGWTVQAAGRLGTSDNSLGPVAGSSPNDIWAFGDFLPSNPVANVDATLSFAEHWNGTRWTVVQTPNAGVNFNSFYAAAATGGWAWGVGEYLNNAYQDRALIEVWNGSGWRIADTPQPGSMRDMLFGASALSPKDVWVVGDQEGANGIFETLVEHWDGTAWSVVPSPDPGIAGNHLYAVDAVSADNIWAVGQELTGKVPDVGLVEHWDGRRWSVVSTPILPAESVMLTGVAVSGGQVWTVGEADSPQISGGQPLVEHFANGAWSIPTLPIPKNQNWTNLWGVAVQSKTVWAVGTYVDDTSDNNNSLIYKGVGNTWTIDPAPNPGSGSNILGGVTVVANHAWAGGMYDDGGSELPYIETN